MRGDVVATAAQIDFSELDDEWDVDSRDETFTSKYHEGREQQRLIFNEPFRDGSVSVEITVRESKKLEEGGEPNSPPSYSGFKIPIIISLGASEGSAVDSSSAR